MGHFDSQSASAGKERPLNLIDAYTVLPVVLLYLARLLYGAGG